MNKFFTLFVICTTLSIKSWAVTSMQEHMQWAALGMANFYMYQLSDGNEKYLERFQRNQKMATKALKKSSFENVNKSEILPLLTKWQTLREKLEIHKVNSQSVGEISIVEGAIRIEYRKYLTDLYLQVFNQESLLSLEAENEIAKTKTLISMLVARTLDVASDDFGPTGITAHDNQFNPEKVAKKVNGSIRFLLKKSSSKDQAYDFKKIQSKFNFIKNPLVDYHVQTPYFLISENLKSMNKLLDKNRFLQVATD